MSGGGHGGAGRGRGGQNPFDMFNM